MVPQVPVARSHQQTRARLALVLVCLVLALGPFAAALGVHHELAAADDDGHRHSDFDLCQWVQLHSAGSVLPTVVLPGRFAAPERHDPPLAHFLSSLTLLASKASRAPPLS
ncbi:hypothetical protein [Nitrospira sp. Kam-Ns4a]